MTGGFLQIWHENIRVSNLIFAETNLDYCATAAALMN